MKDLLKIRPAKLDDLANILQFETNNQEWFAHFLPHYAGYAPTKPQLNKLLRGQEAGLQFLVCLHDGKIIGRFNAQYLDQNKEIIEVSYRIDKYFVNRGIARFALRHLLLVWTCRGVKEIYAKVADYNRSSIKVLLSCGFWIDEFCPETVNLKTKAHDGWVFKWSESQQPNQDVNQFDKVLSY
ncbi:GNAT family N-acetyltransferase [Marinomonas posidonica]|uniref:GCN5-related N-acetyltransferase n=1 Tax=Marinomonas posidonica (strain CECT 7376 / NCIMB 14433 / IVIA-Po-181) TaxID=491952 RepID=F6D0J1_MARPP|nr:GNAT family N-acetyltransferase [Marinomonas posidonica]AEF54789.1 GCN5-related N-acetyltransferase [Marinomonas posidonica IVIA-Po-181]